MAFHLISEGDLLKEGMLGIREPAPNAPPAPPVDLFLVPGLAFDRKGRRLGQGGGYYDAALRARPSAFRVAACYSFQVLPDIPHDEHDEPIDLIVTPDGLYETFARDRAPIMVNMKEDTE